MADNPLRYTNLTYEDILRLLRSKLQADPRFENFRDSEIVSVLLESKAAMIDFVNYYLERRSQENYLDTAKLKSSAILLSGNLGYVVTRSVPAETSMSMLISGPLPSGLVPGNQLVLNRKTSFTLEGLPFVLKNTYRYTFTNADIIDGQDNPDWSKTINFGLVTTVDNYDLVTSASAVSASSVVDIVLMQGEIKSYTVLGTDTDQVGLKFQKYKIDDDTFSNIYSENDLGYDADEDSHDHSQNFTRVAIAESNPFDAERDGTLENYNSFFTIDKRTLLRPDSPLTNEFSTSSVPICHIKTLPDETVMVEFGDNIFARKGLETTSNNIYVEYFSTIGKKANQIGVIGKELQTDEQFIVNSIDISNNLSFTLRKNILGGEDMEDIESIKINAPSIYSSLDRCVTPRDYISYLKTLTSPVNIKNAIAWGEQEESVTSGAPIKKLFNVVLFSALGDLYDVTSDTHQVKMVNGASANTALSAAVLDEPYSPYEITPSSYLNLLIKESVIDEINEVRNLSETSKIKQVLNKLGTKSQITVKNMYVTPFINEFDLTGTVYVRKLSNINYIEKTVNNRIYQYLNKNADFNTPIYISNIIKLIEQEPNVVFSDIAFEPYATSGVQFNYDLNTTAIVDADISAWTPVGSESIDDIEIIYGNAIYLYLSTRADYTEGDTWTMFNQQTVKSISKTWDSDINERNFYNELCKTIYTNLKSLAGAGIANPFADSTNFDNTIIKLRNSFDYMIKWNMIDANGNISNFSMNNQIAKIRIALNYIYR